MGAGAGEKQDTDQFEGSKRERIHAVRYVGHRNKGLEARSAL
jgi:hypothetical protein